MLDLIPNDNQPPQLYTRFIKIERGVKRSNYLASFTASLLTSGGEADPLDIITISPTAFSTEGSYLLSSLEFEETLPTVAHLAAVLKAVHVKAPKYTLYSSMCYWFARATFEGLGYLCHGHVLREKEALYRGRFLRFLKVGRTAVSLDTHKELRCFKCLLSRDVDKQSFAVEEFRKRLKFWQDIYGVNRERTAAS